MVRRSVHVELPVAWENGSFGGPVGSTVSLGPDFSCVETNWVGDRAGPKSYANYVSQPPVASYASWFATAGLY